MKAAATIWITLLLLGTAILGFILTFPLEAGFKQRAFKVQPVRRDPRSDTGWSLAGRPKDLIGIPEEARLTAGAAGIVPQVDVSRLGSAHELGEALAVIQIARLGTLGAIVALFLAWQLAKRTGFPQGTSSPEP